MNESLLFHCRRKAQLFSNLPLYNIPTPKLLVCPAQHFTTRPFEAIGPITPCDIWLRWLLGEGAGLPFAKRIRKVLLFARNKLKAGLAPFFPNGFFLGLPYTIRKRASLLTWRGLGKYTQPPPCSSLRGRRKANGVFAILTNSPSPSPTTSPGGCGAQYHVGRIKTKLSPEMWSGVDWSLSAGPSELERQLDGDKQIGRSEGFLGIVNFLLRPPRRVG